MAMDGHAILDLVLLGILMMGLGCAIDFEEFKQKFKKPWGVSIGLLSQFVFMPAVTFGIAKWLLTDPLLQVALVLVGCSPGGAISNILSWFIGADLPLSIAMTAASSIVAIGMLPLNIYFYVELTGLSASTKIDFIGIILSVAVIIVGTFSGIFIRSKSMKWAACVGKVGGVAGVVLVLIGFIQNSTSDTPIWAQQWETYVASFLASLFGLIIGLGLSLLTKLPKPSCVAISIETSIQNKIIAIAIIGITFNTQQEKDVANAVPLIYAVCATGLNVVWAIAAWKLGWTSYDSKLSFCGLFMTAQNDVSVDNTDSDGNNADKTSTVLQLEELESGRASGMCEKGPVASPLHKDTDGLSESGVGGDKADRA